MGDVSTGDNPKLPRNKKQYSLQIREYANTILNPPEFQVYKALFDSIRESHHLDAPEHLILLDLVVFDFIRTKRLQKHVQEYGDLTEHEAKQGGKFWRSNEAGHLLNAVTSQLRQNMKELMLTPKEVTKKTLVAGHGDIAKWINAPVVDAEVRDKK